MSKLFYLSIAVLLLLAPSALFAGTIRVESTTDPKVYVVKGYSLGEFSGVEVEVMYDAEAFTNPRIIQGGMLGSTTFIPNPSYSKSSVKIAAVSTSAITGSGNDLATIIFDLKGDKPGFVGIARQIVAAVMTGTKIPTQAGATVDIGAPVPESDKPAGGTAPVATGNENTTVTNIGGGISGGTIGTVTLPGDLTSGGDSKKPDSQPVVTDLRKDMTLPVGDDAAKQASAEQKGEPEKKTVEKKDVVFKGALDLFKGYKDEKSVANFVGLFAEAEITGFVQEPAIALSDGETVVKLTIKTKPILGASPKFISTGATINQLSGEGEDVVTWSIELLPKKGVVDASLTIIDQRGSTQFPITVAPKIDALIAKGKGLTETEFAAFIAADGKQKDLNRDGKVDAVDDFIYTANYLVARKIKPVKAVKKNELKGQPKGAEPKIEKPAPAPEPKKEQKPVVKQ